MAAPYQVTTSPTGQTYYQQYDPVTGIYRNVGGPTPEMTSYFSAQAPAPVPGSIQTSMLKPVLRSGPPTYETLSARSEVTPTGTVSAEAQEYIYTTMGIPPISPGQPGYSDYLRIGNQVQKGLPSKKTTVSSSSAPIEAPTYFAPKTGRDIILGAGGIGKPSTQGPTSSQIPQSLVKFQIQALSEVPKEATATYSRSSGPFEGIVFAYDIPGKTEVPTKVGQSLASIENLSLTGMGYIKTGMNIAETIKPPPPQTKVDTTAGIKEWAKAQPTITGETMVLAANAAATGNLVSKEGMEAYAIQERKAAATRYEQMYYSSAFGEIKKPSIVATEVLGGFGLGPASNPTPLGNIAWKGLGFSPSTPVVGTVADLGISSIALAGAGTVEAPFSIWSGVTKGVKDDSVGKYVQGGILESHGKRMNVMTSGLWQTAQDPYAVGSILIGAGLTTGLIYAAKAGAPISFKNIGKSIGTSKFELINPAKGLRPTQYGIFDTAEVAAGRAPVTPGPSITSRVVSTTRKISGLEKLGEPTIRNNLAYSNEPYGMGLNAKPINTVPVLLGEANTRTPFKVSAGKVTGKGATEVLPPEVKISQPISPTGEAEFYTTPSRNLYKGSFVYGRGEEYMPMKIGQFGGSTLLEERSMNVKITSQKPGEASAGTLGQPGGIKTISEGAVKSYTGRFESFGLEKPMTEVRTLTTASGEVSAQTGLRNVRTEVRFGPPEFKPTGEWGAGSTIGQTTLGGKISVSQGQVPFKVSGFGEGTLSLDFSGARGITKTGKVVPESGATLSSTFYEVGRKSSYYSAGASKTMGGGFRLENVLGRGSFSVGGKITDAFLETSKTKGGITDLTFETTRGQVKESGGSFASMASGKGEKVGQIQTQATTQVYGFGEMSKTAQRTQTKTVSLGPTRTGGGQFQTQAMRTSELSMSKQMSFSLDLPDSPQEMTGERQFQSYRTAQAQSQFQTPRQVQVQFPGFSTGQSQFSTPSQVQIQSPILIQTPRQVQVPVQVPKVVGGETPKEITTQIPQSIQIQKVIQNTIQNLKPLEIQTQKPIQTPKPPSPVPPKIINFIPNPNIPSPKITSNPIKPIPIIKIPPFYGGGTSSGGGGGGFPKMRSSRFKRKTGIQPLLTWGEKTRLEIGRHKAVSSIIPITKATVKTYTKNIFGYGGPSGFVKGSKIVIPGMGKKRKRR